MLESEDLLGVFGMLEMEHAAAVIINELLQYTDRRDVPIFIENFTTVQEQTGFVELIYRGWMKHGTYNGEFYANEKFRERVMEKVGDLDGKLTPLKSEIQSLKDKK